VMVKKATRGPRPDPVVARTTSDQSGAWQARVPKAEGKFYAKAKSSSVAGRDGSTIKCRGARSRTISV
jgi:hypothetical protein